MTLKERCVGGNPQVNVISFIFVLQNNKRKAA